MATLREVKTRIRSVQSTRRITKAMEMVSAAKLRRAQQAVEQAKPYAKKLDEMLGHLSASARTEIVHPYFDIRPVRRKTLVIIASDRGLCSSYNSNVFRRAESLLTKSDDVETEVVAIGKRTNDYFKRRRWPITSFHSDWGGVLDYSRAREIVTDLTDRFVSGQTDEITLVFTRFLSMVRYQVTIEPYLPVAPRDEAEEGSGNTGGYIFEPSSEEIYSALMPSYATTKLVTALVESFASEHGSRMMAMGNATKNAGEMVQALSLEYNKARQAQITKELLEVVGGAEALAG